MSRSGLLSLLALACASAIPVSGKKLVRFDRVAEGVYRSSQPSDDDLIALQHDYGLKSVIKLNHGVDHAPVGVTIAPSAQCLGDAQQQQIDQILDEIDAAAKPILIHCTAGQDRTGLVVALYKIRHGEPVAQAYADMVQHGFRPWPGLWRYWRKAAHW